MKITYKTNTRCFLSPLRRNDYNDYKCVFPIIKAAKVTLRSHNKRYCFRQLLPTTNSSLCYALIHSKRQVEDNSQNASLHCSSVVSKCPINSLNGQVIILHIVDGIAKSIDIQRL